MSSTKNKGYEGLETSEKAAERGLRRISRPAFLGEPKRKGNMPDPDIIEYFKTEEGEMENLVQPLWKGEESGRVRDFDRDENLRQLHGSHRGRPKV